MKNSLSILAVIVTIVASCSVKFPTISPDEFETLLSDPEVQLIDARRADEVAQGYIAGSINIDVEKEGFKEMAVQMLDKNRKVAVHCQSGKRGAKAAKILRRAGYDVYNLEGGFNAWLEAGKPYIAPVQETSLEDLFQAVPEE